MDCSLELSTWQEVIDFFCYGLSQANLLLIRIRIMNQIYQFIKNKPALNTIHLSVFVTKINSFVLKAERFSKHAFVLIIQQWVCIKIKPVTCFPYFITILFQNKSIPAMYRPLCFPVLDQQCQPDVSWIPSPISPYESLHGHVLICHLPGKICIIV